jgi:hypothetical protein
MNVSLCWVIAWERTVVDILVSGTRQTWDLLTIDPTNLWTRIDSSSRGGSDGLIVMRLAVRHYDCLQGKHTASGERTHSAQLKDRLSLKSLGFVSRR